MNEEPEFQEISLQDLMRVLWRRRRFILLVVFLVTVAALIFAFTATPRYEASATLEVQNVQSQMLFMPGELPFGYSVEIEREKEYLRSRTVVEEVVRALDLDYEIESDPPGLEAFLSDLTIRESPQAQRLQIRLHEGSFDVLDASGRFLHRGAPGQESVGPLLSATLDEEAPARGILRISKVPFQQAVSNLLQRLSISEKGRGSQVLEIRVEDSDPERARDVVNTLTRIHIDRSRERLGRREQQKMEFIAGQLDEVRAGLEEDEQALNRYKQDQGVFLLDEEARQLIEEMADLEVEATRLMLQEQDLESLGRALQDEETLRFLVGDASGRYPAIEELVRQLSAQLVELGGLRGRYTPEHPRIRSLQSSIAETRRAISSSLINALEATRQQRRGLDEAMRGYEARLAGLPETERQLAGLTRRAQVNAELYIFLLKAHEEARIGRASVVSNVQVIDPAIAPLRPVSPRKKLITVLALMVGSMLGIMGAFFLEFLYGTVGGMEDLEKQIGLPIVSVFPKARRSEERMELEEPLRLKQSHSPVAEAVRSLRTHIEHQVVQGEGNSILITSPLSGEGKTTVLSALGVALSLAGESVLLIDGDLRHPRLCGRFGLAPGPGLAGLIQDGMAADEVIVPVEEDLYLIPGGSARGNPAEILLSPRLAELVQSVRQRFDYVLIDSPASAQFTDAEILCRYADSVYLVVQPWESKRSAVERALSRLERVNAPLRGIIPNRVPIAADEYSYYYPGYDTDTDISLRERVRNMVATLLS